ncbi:hypothetical protein NVIRPANT_00071 [Pantoea sp. Nvir]|nr:hypothetical protein NVIRPANT_00071 [Pantoea sp. Nvir]
MIANQLDNYPIIPDKLLDTTIFYQPPVIDAYSNELCQYLIRLPFDDDEQQLEISIVLIQTNAATANYDGRYCEHLTTGNGNKRSLNLADGNNYRISRSTLIAYDATTLRTARTSVREGRKQFLGIGLW